MTRASCRALAEVVKLLRARGISSDPLVAGTPVSLRTISTPSASIEWDHFVVIVANLEELVGGPESNVALLRELASSPLTRPLQSVLGLAMSPAQGYRLLFGWLGPSLYPGCRTEVQVQPGGRVRAVLEIEEGLAGSRPFLYAARGAFEALPLMLGLPLANVAATVTERRGEYLIDAPRPRTLFTRARGVLNLFSDRRNVIDELVRQRAQLNQNYDALQASHDQLRLRELQLETEIAERARIEEQTQRLNDQLRHAQKMDALGRFAGGMAHDFNNLLTVILGLSTEVADYPDDPVEVRKIALQIRDAVHEATDLTRQLLTFGRGTPLSTRVFDAHQVLSSFEATLRRFVGGRVELRQELAPGAAPLSADPTYLRQVMVNLVANARDAMPSGGIVIVATELREADVVTDARQLIITVSDTGVGMEEAVVAHVFEPFFTTKPMGKGTGLGMSMVFRLISDMGGTVTIDSAPGEGTTVRLELPLSDQPIERVIPDGSVSAVEPSGGETILVVEDLDALRKVTVRALERAGYEVLSAASVDEGAEVAAGRADIDLLVSDIMLGSGRGTDLAVDLLERLPELKVLFVSGYASDDVNLSGNASLESAGFLQKPFGIEQLIAEVRAILDE